MRYWKTIILSFSETPETTTLSRRDRRNRPRKSSRMSSESSLDVDNRVAFNSGNNSGSRLTEGGESDDAIGPARSESKTSVDSGNKFFFAGIPFATPFGISLLILRDYSIFRLRGYHNNFWHPSASCGSILWPFSPSSQYLSPAWPPHRDDDQQNQGQVQARERQLITRQNYRGRLASLVLR